MSKDKSQKYYIYKPQSIIQDKRLTPLEQDYLCLIGSLQKAGRCIASNKYFADYFKVSRPRAVEVIGSLRKKKIIESTEKKQGKKTIERTIEIIDFDSKKTLLMSGFDSKESPAGLVRKSGFDSKESQTPIIKGITKDITKYSQNSNEFRLENLLLSLILERKPDYKKPYLQTWAKHIDLMIRRDNREPGKIEAVIRWTQQDDFEQNNILSTVKLRKRFDQLEMKTNKQKGQKNERSTITAHQQKSTEQTSQFKFNRVEIRD